MSGTNLKYLVICRVFFGACYAVIWHTGSVMPVTVGKDPQSSAFHPAIFPDTLCFASSWSPLYSGFGINEGMIYGGSSKFDLSIKTQYHKLMSNHQLSVGFPILDEINIKAGLQLHYTLSALHGVESLHKGSCSGGLIISPRPNWQASLCSMHILCFPKDSIEQLLEPKLGAGINFDILPTLGLCILAQKTDGLSWQLFGGIAWRPLKILSCGLKYEIGNDNLFFNLELAPGNWKMYVSMGLHRYLGFTQQIMIAYER